MSRVSLWQMLLLPVVLTAACDSTPAPTPTPGTVHLRGHAYAFNQDPSQSVVGAKIGIAELPDLTTTTAADGSYDLEVPDGQVITPMITAPGYSTMHLQTWTTAGKDLEEVNFQTPDNGTFVILATLLKVAMPATACNFATTVSTKAIQPMTYMEFRKSGAHGVAGATAVLEPEVATPTYFNKNVVPDKNQALTSEDGGVVWINLPEGVYTVKATHPTRKFESITITCKNGRLVNANPPWGLREM